MIVSGPCVICGAINYELSLGGVDICPTCDCGNFGQTRIKSLQTEIQFLKDKLAVAEEVIGTLSEHCPDCADVGFIQIGDDPGEPEPCVWCTTRPYSKFNLNKILVTIRGEDKNGS